MSVPVPLMLDLVTRRLKEALLEPATHGLQHVHPNHITIAAGICGVAAAGTAASKEHTSAYAYT